MYQGVKDFSKVLKFDIFENYSTMVSNHLYFDDAELLKFLMLKSIATNAMSNFEFLQGGIPQGSVLGLKLFFYTCQWCIHSKIYVNFYRLLKRQIFTKLFYQNECR